jgi:hypothetical protein
MADSHCFFTCAHLLVSSRRFFISEPSAFLLALNPSASSSWLLRHHKPSFGFLECGPELRFTRARSAARARAASCSSCAVHPGALLKNPLCCSAASAAAAGLAGILILLRFLEAAFFESRDSMSAPNRD